MKSTVAPLLFTLRVLQLTLVVFPQPASAAAPLCCRHHNCTNDKYLGLSENIIERSFPKNINSDLDCLLWYIFETLR